VRRLVVLIVLVRVFAGCARPTPSVYQPAWDGEASQFEVPPARAVLAADAGGGGAFGPGGGSASDLPVCTKQDQLGCCYDNQRVFGLPRCGWQRLGSGAAVTITELWKDDKKVTAPVPLTLTAVGPDRFDSLEACANTPVGFVLSGPGVEDGELGSTITNYELRSNGAWATLGGGATVGLVAGRDTAGSSDGGGNAPTFKFGATLCQPPTPDGTYRASIVLFDEIDFKLAGESYHAALKQSPNGAATAYYLLVDKGW
jgi:hypothetical protein